MMCNDEYHRQSVRIKKFTVCLPTINVRLYFRILQAYVPGDVMCTFLFPNSPIDIPIKFMRHTTYKTV